MADVFISYARDDRDLVEPLAHALEAGGFSVWWDRQLVGGDEFSTAIERELSSAAAVLVCWSRAGSRSRWVRDEASVAADAGKLVAATIDGTEAPIGFRQYHCLDLQEWARRRSDKLPEHLIRAVHSRVHGGDAPQALADRTPVNSARQHRWPLAALGVLVAGVGAIWLGWTDRTPTASNMPDPAEDMSAPVRRYGILLPEHAPVDFVGSSPLRSPVVSMAITPDGNRLIYTGPDAEEISALYMRRLDDFTVERLPGTGGAYHPAISPDGRQVSFFAYDELRVTRLDGGTARTIIAAPNPRGGAWWGNDRIIYADQEGRNLWVVGVDGGKPRPLRLADDRLPDGRQIMINRELMMPMPHGEGLLTASWPAEGSSGRLVLYEPGPGTLTTVLPLAVVAQAVDDALVYVIGNDLLAVDFDPASVAVSGEPRKVGGELRRDGGLAQFVLSESTLIYATGAPHGQVQIAELTAQWELADTVIGPDAFGSLAVSPDGTRIAATVMVNNSDIWIYDLAGGQRRRLTRGGNNHHPFWSADGETIYFSHSASESTPGVYSVSADSVQFDKTLIFPTSQHITALHPLGLATLPVVSPAEGDNESERDMSILDLETGEQTIVANRAGVTEDLAALSPDSRWLAFTSDASGRYEVLVMPASGNGVPVQVSSNGGEEPLWSADMSALYYRYGTRLFRVEARHLDDTLEFGNPEIVFDDPTWINIGGYSYWENPNGGFYLLRVDQAATTRELRVVEGWRNIR